MERHDDIEFHKLARTNTNKSPRKPSLIYSRIYIDKEFEKQLQSL